MDHGDDMRAIAAELARLSEQPDGARRTPEGRASAGALREAVAQIERRQADLERGVGGVHQPHAVPEPRDAPVQPPIPRLAAVHAAASRARIGRDGSDLSDEVAETFARFSRDLREAIEAVDVRPNVEALDREMRHISRAVDGLGADLARADDVATIGQQTREVRDMMAASARPVADPLQGLDRQVSALEDRLSRLACATTGAADPRAASDGATPSPEMTSLEARIADLSARIERGFEARGSTDLIEGLSRRVDEIHGSLRERLSGAAVDTRPLEDLVRGLTDRVEQARGASADFRQLEAALRDAATRMDGAAVGADANGVKAIEAQLARVADRLERSETSLRALDGVEHSLGELFSQFEVTRQVAIDAAETAARTAARDTLRAAMQNANLGPRQVDPSPGLAEQVASVLEELRAHQDRSERLTQGTLADIQAAVERLVRLPPPAPAGAAPSRRDRARSGGEPLLRVDPSDQLLEPGSGRGGGPRPDDEAATRSGPGEGGADPVPASAPPADADGEGPSTFIAAARRAAQMAQASAAASAARKADRSASARAPRDEERVDTAPDAILSRARAFLSRRRRPLLLGLAAVVMLVGAVDLIFVAAQPQAAPQASSADGAVSAAPRVAAASPPAPAKSAALPADDAVLPPAIQASARPPLPSFVTGPAKAQQAVVDGVPQGLRDQAASGDASAQFEIGLRYADGRGVPRDAKQAAAWFAKAGAQGLAPAEYRLGSAYEKGVGVDRDPALALSWYTKAAEAGNVRAMHNLAVMSAEGVGGKPDYAKASLWFGKASAYGVRDSQFNLAILYARGLGIEQSLPQSYTWFSIAAAEGDEDAGHKRDEVAAKLDGGALAAAKAAAEAFHAATPPEGANEVAPPPGGWDAAPTRAQGAASARVSQL